MRIKYTLNDIRLGDKVKVKGETEYGEVFELLSSANEVAARYSNGEEFDIHVSTIDDVIKPATGTTPTKVEQTTSVSASQPSQTPPKWDGNGSPPVGAIVVTASWPGRPLKVVRHMRKYWRCEDEKGQQYRVSTAMMRPTTLPFNEAETDQQIKRGRLVTLIGDRHGMDPGRLWVVLAPTKNNPGTWNCVPLDPPDSFTYDYVPINAQKLTVRKFQNLTIPV